MFRLLFIMLLWVLAIIVGPYLAGSQGYVLIETESYRYELSITVLAALMVAILAGVYLVEAVISRFLRLSKSSYNWFSNHKQDLAHRQTLEGLMAFGAGDYKKAQRLMTANAKHSEQPLLNFITAAQAAQHAGSEFDANHYLMEAGKISGDNHLMVEMTRVKILMAQQKWNEAKDLIDQLLVKNEQPKTVLGLAIQIYQQTQSFEALDGLLKRIEKSGLCDSKSFDRLEKQVELGLMDAKAKEGSEALVKWWGGQNRHRRGRFFAQVAMIERLMDLQSFETAYPMVMEAVKRDENDGKLVPKLHRQILRLQQIDTAKLRKLLEKQLKHSEFKTDIQRSLAYLYLRAGDFAHASLAFQALLKDERKLLDNDRLMAMFVFDKTGETALSDSLKENLQQVIALPHKA